MSKAPASTRAYEKVTFSAGMVTLPLSIYTGTVSDHGIKRNQFVQVEDGDKTVDHAVGYGNIDKETGELIVDKSKIVKKIATEYGHVYVEDHEIEELFDVDPKTITVKEIQPQYLFHQGAYVPKSLYFVEVTPTTVGKKKVANVTAEKNFAVVLAALRSHNAMAVVEFTTRGVPKPGILMPNGTLWTLYHTDELREQRPLPEVEVPNEVAEAAFDQYLKPFWGEAPLDLTDKRTELIQAFADEKAQAGDFAKPAEVEVAAPAEPAANDLMAMLSASIESAKAKGA